MNPTFDVIIIGGGLGGLIAGATLSKKGKKVLLLEQHYIPGGCATTFKRKDFVMEVGLHEMDGMHKMDLKQEVFSFLEVEKNVEFIKVPELFKYKGNGIDFVQPHGEKETITALVNKYPEEEKGIIAFFKIITNTIKELSLIPAEKWKQIVMTPIMPILTPNLVKISKKSLGYWLDHLFKDESLKLILQGNLLYYHNDPYAMSMLYFSAGQAGYLLGGGLYIKGGSQQLSNYLQETIEKYGGQVLLGKKVTKIRVQNGKVNGVVFQDSFNLGYKPVKAKADTIISNIAIPLIKELLPPIESKKIAQKTDHLKHSISLLTIYLGFKKEIKSLGNRYYSTFVYGKDVNSIKDIKSNNIGDWENRTFIFVDYSQIDSGIAPEGKSFGSICIADYLTDWDSLSPAEYKIKKDKVANILIDRLDKEIPGIKNNIEYVEVGTAKTIKKFTSNPSGTPYGYAQTPEQSGLNRTGIKSPIKGLYFSGAWTFPGGGFTGAIISGSLCAKLVEKRIKGSSIEKNSKINDDRIIKLQSTKIVAENTIELAYKKPSNFTYKPGQYAMLDLMLKGKMEIDMPIRPLSIVSHPTDSELKFTMRLSNSSFKKTVNTLKVGDESRVFGPMGNFFLSPKKKEIVFLVSGIGITPIISFLKELELNNHEQPITLFYSNKSEEATTYHEMLLKSKLPNYTYIPIFTNTKKRLDINQLLNQLVTFDNKDYYIVGTEGFINGMTEILEDNPTIDTTIFIDNFG